MIKKRTIYSLFIVLICIFVAVLFVLPKLQIETKNDAYSYETKVFNKKQVSKVNIEVDEETWANAIANAAEEEYVKGSVTINGKRVDNVAIRTKGNLSLRSVVNSDSERYSLKIDFDYYDDTQSLYGLKKLNLNNNYSDSTLMREYISYELMEKLDLPTPAHSYMYVTVNGDDYGLFLGVEQVEETFLAREFNDTSGFLYKPDGVGSDLAWISDDIDDYTDLNLKTNKKDADASNIINFLDVINNGGNLEEVMDVDEMLRYFAMNTALVSLDSYQGNMKHNYYLYEKDGKYSIIPWDYNMSFGGFGAGMGGGGMGRGVMPQGMGDGQGFGGMKPNANTDTSTTENNKTQPSENNNSNAAVNNNVNTNKDAANNTATGFTPPDMQQMRAMGGDLNMMESDLMNEQNINFSIDTPVSGTTLEERPLLNALLSNDEYRAKYEQYLKEIATTMLTEEEIQKMTNELASLLTTYVEADPTKFSTTEEFLKAVSGENSLPAFAKARSESILKQLSGELVVENTSSSTPNNGGTPNRNNSQDTDSNTSTNENTQGNQITPSAGGNFNPSQMPNGNAGGTPPTGNNTNGNTDGSKATPPNDGNFDPSQMPNGGAGFKPPTNNQDTSSNESQANSNGQSANRNKNNTPPTPPAGGNFDPSQMPNMGQDGNGPGNMAMGPNEANENVQQKWTKKDFYIVSGFTALLIIATIFIFKFKRRK